MSKRNNFGSGRNMYIPDESSKDLVRKYGNEEGKNSEPKSGFYGAGSGAGSSTGYYGAGSHSNYSISDNNPKLAFVSAGIKFIGSPKHKLDNIKFHDGDLIINCTGDIWVSKPPPAPKLFAKKMPSWMSLPEINLNANCSNDAHLAEQLVLDWPDMKSPPDSVDYNFWKALLDQCLENGVKRIIVCCFAGQGRTGTALASLMLVSGAATEPNIAIERIRDNYNEKAIETKSQEQYIYGLIYEETISSVNDL